MVRCQKPDERLSRFGRAGRVRTFFFYVLGHHRSRFVVCPRKKEHVKGDS